MKKRTLMILGVAMASIFMMVGLATAGDGCGYSKGSAETAKAVAPVKAEGETVVLSVSNMTCGSCVNHVTKSLAAVEGVKDVTVSLEKGTAEVIYDAAKVKPEMLTSTVVKAGYPAELATVSKASVKMSGKDCAAKCAKKGCDPAACGMKTADAGNPDSK